ncbi:MAG: glycosylhydrolase-like jelly roll fold domain-containing protein, partial [Thermoguttaceae bacterium]
EHKFGKGRVVCGQTARDVLLADGVKPDFEFKGADDKTSLDYIHRRDGRTDIYYVINHAKRGEDASCTFRVSGKAPELWNPVSGEIRPTAAFSQADGTTTVPLEFPPYGSWFVVFRKPVPADAKGAAKSNAMELKPIEELSGSWTVKFDPKWGGPDSVEFDKLVSWTDRPEKGIHFYSGTATYQKTFDLPESAKPGERIFLDLGKVRELAKVWLNGRDLGIVWAPPFRVEATEALKPKGNILEIDVVNFWPNRVIGDQSLPLAKRFTRTNVAAVPGVPLPKNAATITKDTALMPSGLMGPVRLLKVVEE